MLGGLLPGLQSHPGTLILLAESSGDFVGIATCFTCFSTFKAQPLINIHDIYVRPKQRGRGIASGLIRTAEDIARTRGCCKITLEVRITRSPKDSIVTWGLVGLRHRTRRFSICFWRNGSRDRLVPNQVAQQNTHPKKRAPKRRPNSTRMEILVRGCTRQFRDCL
ncbi:GNAT family N-acetyltransferase [Solemya velesiana gill symbiont]|uniref:GNAT family N-acetyltransferase n=1 Tax=Solemya velesiana gill symbiont TaxID=1918948 RepID=UPI00099701A5